MFPGHGVRLCNVWTTSMWNTVETRSRGELDCGHYRKYEFNFSVTSVMLWKWASTLIRWMHARVHCLNVSNSWKYCKCWLIIFRCNVRWRFNYDEKRPITLIFTLSRSRVCTCVNVIKFKVPRSNHVTYESVDGSIALNSPKKTLQTLIGLVSWQRLEN